MKKSILGFGKLTHIAGLAVMLAFVAFTGTGCKKEGCTDDTAINYDEKADEDDGSCEFERDAFIGTYEIDISSVCDNPIDETNENNLSMTITANNGATNLVNINIDSGLINLVGTISGSTITIQNQSVEGYSYSGNGTINGTVFFISFDEEDSSGNCNYEIDGTKLS
jgi:hypothetical protein